MPKNWTATRIEQRAGGGFPDLFLLIDGLPVLAELKVCSGSNIKLRPAQIAFIYAHSAKNGLAFVLASTPDRRKPTFWLIKGADIMNLAQDPRPENHGSRFESVEDLFEALGSEVRAHYARLVASPAALRRRVEPCGPAGAFPSGEAERSEAEP